MQLEVSGIVGMKSKQQTKQIVFLSAILVYLLIIFVTVFAIHKVPIAYYELQEEEYHAIKQDIQKNLLDNTITNFVQISKDYAVEFAIFDMQTENLVYSTLPIQTPQQLQGILNEKSVNKEEAYEYTVGEEMYYIWISQYYTSPQIIIDKWLVTIIYLVATLFVLILLIIFMIIYKQIRPLQRLKANIYKLRSYQLEKIVAGETVNLNQQDALSYELIQFSQDLLGKMNATARRYTSLEKELQTKNEEAQYREKLLAALSHDLKTPLNIVQLQLGKVIASEHNLTPHSLELLERAEQKTATTIAEINDLIKVVYQNSIEQLQMKTAFDLIELLYDVVELFTEQFQEKEILVEMDTDYRLNIIGNRIRFKQLIYNAISNIYTHAPQTATVKISCYQENETIYLTFYNDAKQMTETQLENIFNLFYRISTHESGSGLGLYTIKEIVSELGGQVKFRNHKQGIELTCVFTTTN